MERETCRQNTSSYYYLPVSTYSNPRNNLDELFGENQDAVPDFIHRNERVTPWNWKIVFLPFSRHGTSLEILKKFAEFRSLAITVFEIIINSCTDERHPRKSSKTICGRYSCLIPTRDRVRSGFHVWVEIHCLKQILHTERWCLRKLLTYIGGNVWCDSTENEVSVKNM